jgi:probable rRNA maturation factor
MLDLVFKNSTSSGLYGRNFFNDVLSVAAKVMKLKGRVEISVNLVGPNAIKSLNKKYRGKNKTTDVLSFPIGEHSLKKYGIMPLGDIFICPIFVKNQAVRDGISIKERMAHLAVHGFLHLLGHDHEKSEKEAEKMERFERKILKNIKL